MRHCEEKYLEVCDPNKSFTDDGVHHRTTRLCNGSSLGDPQWASLRSTGGIHGIWGRRTSVWPRSFRIDKDRIITGNSQRTEGRASDCQAI